MAECKNCKKPLAGVFCHYCGEKMVEKNDFSLRTLISQIVDGVFNIDSKIYRSFLYLLFKPGKLTTKYIEGIRKPFMKPIQLFLVANILFFLLLTQSDILRIPAKYFFNGTRDVNIELKMDKSGETAAEFMDRYDKTSKDVSKSAVIIIVPFIGLALWLINYNKDFLFGMHLIFAIHYVSFFFLYCCLLAITVIKFGNNVVQIFIVGINFIYVYFALRQVYKTTIMASILKSVLVSVVFFGITLLYRTAISYISYYLL